MRFLVDVNVLVAWAWRVHISHDRADSWFAGLRSQPETMWLTCPITELGFLRVSLQMPGRVDLKTAKALLASMQHADGLKHGFLSDDLTTDRLPLWARGHRQLTDGYLAALAKKHEAALATLDEGIPEAFLLPV